MERDRLTDKRTEMERERERGEIERLLIPGGKLSLKKTVQKTIVSKASYIF